MKLQNIEGIRRRRRLAKKRKIQGQQQQYHEAKYNRTICIDDRDTILFHRKMEKANQDEEKGDGSTQTQEEEGKAAWVEAPWHKFANIKSRDKYKDCGAEFKGSYTRWKQHVLPSV